jgi:hypothetical protein
MDKIDIWRSAKLLIDLHGVDARTVAAMHSDEMLERGDIEGQKVWVRVLKAIIALTERVTVDKPN